MVTAGNAMGWPEGLLQLFRAARNGPVHDDYGPLITMLQTYCFSADKFVVAPELPDFIVAPEVPSEVTSQHYVWPIHLVVQAVTAKYNFVPRLAIQVRDGQAGYDTGTNCYRADAQM